MGFRQRDGRRCGRITLTAAMLIAAGSTAGACPPGGGSGGGSAAGGGAVAAGGTAAATNGSDLGTTLGLMQVAQQMQVAQAARAAEAARFAQWQIAQQRQKQIAEQARFERLRELRHAARERDELRRASVRRTRIRGGSPVDFAEPGSDSTPRITVLASRS